MSEFEKANLIFLDAIERRQGDVIKALANSDDALKQLLPVVISEIAQAIKENTDKAEATIAAAVAENAEKLRAAIELKNLTVKETIVDLSAVVQAVYNSESRLVGKFEELARRYDSVVMLLQAMLEELQKKKKFKVTPDRNYYTRLIQEVNIEQAD